MIEEIVVKLNEQQRDDVFIRPYGEGTVLVRRETPDPGTFKLHMHLNLTRDTDDMQVWSVGEEKNVRVAIGNYDDEGYTVSQSRFVLTDEEAIELVLQLKEHLGMDND